MEASRDNSKKVPKGKFWETSYGGGIFTAANSKPAS